jgi:hypothetical protein
MYAVVPTERELTVLRSIARAEFGYGKTKDICSRAGWELAADERHLGFLQYYIDFGGRRTNRRLLAVCVREGSEGPFAFVPLYCFGENAGDPAQLPRGPFDRAFRHIATGLETILGKAYRAGAYTYAHRGDAWPYSYMWWRVADASLALVQDEFDIQLGMDVSLWVQPARAKVKLPVHHNE